LSKLRSNIARNLAELEILQRMAKTRIPHKRKGAINECMEALVSAPLAVEDALVVQSQCSYASEASG